MSVGEGKELAVLGERERSELALYVRQRNAGMRLLRVTVNCATCGGTFETENGVGCGLCHPGGKTLAEMEADSYTWPGHAFVWDSCVGMAGRWVLACDRAMTSRDDLGALADVLTGARHDISTLSAAREEIERLRAVVANMDAPSVERANAEAARAMRLADEAGELRAQLDAKRIECDTLRDLLHGREETSADALRAEYQKRFGGRV